LTFTPTICVKLSFYISQMIVEVFKTDVADAGIAKLIVQQLVIAFPDSRINFDLEDCDKILRIEAEAITPEKIIALLNANNCYCEVLL
jgi:hypothetical protein